MGFLVLQGVNVTRPKKEELAFEKKKKKEDNLVAVLLSAFGDFRVLSKIGVLPRYSALFKSQAFVVSVTDVKFKSYLENNAKST